MPPGLGTMEILVLFKENILVFLDSLTTLFPDEAEIIVSRVFLENHIPVQLAISHFAKIAIPCKNKIENREDKFFLDNPDLFSNAEQGRVSFWKSLWASNRLDKAEREQIWKWVDFFLQLSEMYVENCENHKES